MTDTGTHHPELPQIEFHHDQMAMKLEVVMPADGHALEEVMPRIMDVVGHIDCAAGKEFEIETAIREALANAIKHGCCGDPNKRIECCIACEEAKGMLIVVRDPGTGFDPLSIPDCTVGENLYSNHGRGIYLINQLMDEVKFEKGGTEIHMRKY